MLSATNQERKEELRVFWLESQELTMIFQKIIATTKKRMIIED